MRRTIVVCGCLAVAVIVGVTAAQALAGSGSITGPQVASPISVQIGKVSPYKGNPSRLPHGPLLPVTISFIARVAIPNGASWYQVNMQFTPTRHCAYSPDDGLKQRTTSDLRTGQRVRLTGGVADCPGVFKGDVVYRGPAAHDTNQDVPGVGYITGALVGTFSFHTG